MSSLKSLKSTTSLRSQGGSEFSCGEDDAEYRGKLYYAVAAHIKKQKALGRSVGPGEMPNQMQNAVWAAQRDGWLREVIEIKHPDGGWRRPGFPKKRKLPAERKRAIGQVITKVNYRIDQCKRLKVSMEQDQKARKVHLKKLKQRSAKVKAELAKLESEMDNAKQDIDFVKQEQVCLSKELQVSNMMNEAIDMVHTNEGLSSAVMKLTEDNAKVVRQIEELKEKVAAQELLRLK